MAQINANLATALLRLNTNSLLKLAHQSSKAVFCTTDEVARIKIDHELAKLTRDWIYTKTVKAAIFEFTYDSMRGTPRAQKCITFRIELKVEDICNPLIIDVSHLEITMNDEDGIHAKTLFEGNYEKHND